jgi:hypothetical protein
MWSGLTENRSTGGTEQRSESFHSRIYWIDGRHTGRSEGATAEKAVPFPALSIDPSRSSFAALNPLYGGGSITHEGISDRVVAAARGSHPPHRRLVAARAPPQSSPSAPAGTPLAIPETGVDQFDEHPLSSAGRL